ncbi:MAG: GFA family protein [Acidiferrobacterales bacterium]
MTAKLIEGGCLCGAVRYRANGTPYNLTNCHCTLCRRASGAPFVSWASFNTSDLEFVAGSPTHYVSSTEAVRGFCAHCGTQLTFQFVKRRHEIDVTIASMDQAHNIEPQDHVWVRSRLRWVKLIDSLPQYDTDRCPID